jgi:Tfp pilus assembly protein FimT
LDHDAIMHYLKPQALNQKGTTIVELLLVLGLVGVVTAAAAQYLLAAVPKSQRLTATAEVAVEIRAARRLAIAHRIPIRAAFDAAAGVLRVEHAYHPEQVLRRYEYGRRGIGTALLSRGTSVNFYPNGRAASPVTITLMTIRGEASKITVSITGKVTWS